MSEPSALCLSVILPPGGEEAWRNATLLPPEHWSDWDSLDVMPSDFALWRRIGHVRVAAVINDIVAEARGSGTLIEQRHDGRLDLAALLVSENWQEQLLILGAVRMLEGFGAVDGWAMMHDYVFERAGTAWAMRFPAVGRAAIAAEPMAEDRAKADALVLPFLDVQRRRDG